MRIAGAACVCLLLVAVPVQAQLVAVPDTMNYQATLLDPNGDLIATGQYVVEISIYDTDAVSTPPNTLVWGPQKFNGGGLDGESPQIQVIDGEFSIILGPEDTFVDATFPNGRPLSDAFLEANRWLEITVVTVLPGAGGPTTFAPRQRLLSAPYAMRAKDAETLGNQTLKVIGGDVGIGTDPVSNIALTVAKTNGPTLRIENLDNTASGNRSIIEFTEGGVLAGQVGFSSTTNNNFVIESVLNGDLVLKSLGELLWEVGQNRNARFGKLVLGDMGFNSGWQGIANILNANTSSYSLLLSDLGDTFLNAKSGRTVFIRNNNNVDVAMFTSSSISLLKNTSVTGNLSVTGSINPGSMTVSGNLRVNGASSAGDALIGNVGHAGWAGFSNVNMANTSNYALIQQNDGHTILNARSTKPLEFRLGNVRRAWFEQGRALFFTNDTVLEILGELRLRASNNTSTWTLYSHPNLWFYFLRQGVIKGGIEPIFGGWFALSDRSQKEDIRGLGNALDTSLKLRPVSYRGKGTGGSGSRSIGFIAQDVQQFMPELVTKLGDNLGMNYDGFGVLAIGAIQELNAKIETLESRLAQLEAVVAGLTN